jgi:hypothetical protein
MVHNVIYHRQYLLEFKVHIASQADYDHMSLSRAKSLRSCLSSKERQVPCLFDMKVTLSLHFKLCYHNYFGLFIDHIMKQN